MKAIIAGLILATSLSSLASQNASIVKVFDGTNATCKTSQDAYRYKLQAHLVKQAKYEINGDNLELDLKATMLSCDKTETGYSFSDANLFDTFTYQVLMSVDENGEAVFSTVEVSTNEAEVVLFDNKTYQKVVSIESKNNSTKTTEYSASVALDKVLNASELEKFNAGEEVQKTLDLFLKRNINVESNDLNMRYTQSYGAFRLKLKLKK
ncbi:hypothetical protein BIY24_15765 [Halobacteriovorax marinus]|uniref:hypothetical protein n=1 Tax=Halobacteriovorax marinus TaxID=97084 RepID=UPI000BC356D2|nr:hypothetical protein [Halobacteriovorax marinus]ATH09344.1 hypothetical protein BIY24_15765 [Halobacteriovorax marinus]